MHNEGKSRLHMIAAMVIFGSISIFVRSIGISSGQLALCRAVIAAVLICAPLLESYDPDTVEAVEPYNTLLLIREDDALPPKYTNLQSLSFSFGGEAHVYRILTSQDLLELTVTEGECVEIDGSAKIFWKVSVASKYHASFKDLQNSLN